MENALRGNENWFELARVRDRVIESRLYDVSYVAQLVGLIKLHVHPF